jgi:hypothetical protein
VVAETVLRSTNVNGVREKVTQRIHLVPELLKPTGLTDEIRADHHAMRAIAGHTQVKPDQRETLHAKLGQDLNKIGDDINNIGLKVDLSSNIINDALNFTPPTILWRDAVTPNKDGTFISARSKVYQKDSSLGNWAIVYDKDRVDDAKESLQVMQRASKAIDVKVGDPIKIGISMFNPQTRKPLSKAEKIKLIADKIS